MTFWETIERGEYVIFALAALSIVIIIIWIVKSVNIIRQKNTYQQLMPKVRDSVMEGDIDNARQTCIAIGSPGARVVEAGLRKVGQPMSEIKSSIRDLAVIEKEQTETGVRWLRAIAVISPLLGLGGTLVGIIDRLRDLGEATGPVDTGAVCSALAPTIVTTVAGIGVGIFSLIALTFLEGTVNSAKKAIDKVGTLFIDMLNEST